MGKALEATAIGSAGLVIGAVTIALGYETYSAVRETLQNPLVASIVGTAGTLMTGLCATITYAFGRGVVETIQRPERYC